MSVWLHYLEDFDTDLNFACEVAEVGAFSTEDIESIKAHVKADLGWLFCPVPGEFDFEDGNQPQGSHETVEFGGTAGGDLKGSAPMDWWNLTSGQTAKVYPENFDDEIKAADTANDRIEGTAWALANVAAHELGHTFGLNHFNCYGDPEIDPEDTDSDNDDVGDQNLYVMSTGNTGATAELAITQLDFSPMSLEVLEFAKDLRPRRG